MNQRRNFLFFMLMLLISASGYAQTDTKTFTGKAGEYEIQLPVSWKITKSEYDLEFLLQDATQNKREMMLEKMSLESEATEWTTQTMAKVQLEGVNEMVKAGNMKLSGNGTTTINGTLWSYMDYTSAGKRTKIYNAIYKKNSYSFFYVAPENDYKAGDAAAEKTIHSFRFKDMPAASPAITTTGNTTATTPVATPANTAGKFYCDTTHKPYKYHAFIWESKLDTKNKTGVSVIGKLPAATALQAISFYDKKQVSLVAGKTQHIDDEGVTYDFTNVYNFPATLDAKYHAADMKDGLMAIRAAKAFEFSMITTEAEKSGSLKQHFSQQISQMINSAGFKAVHKIEDSYYQDEFNKRISKPVKTIEKINIPGIDCYLITLEENALFISINDKLYFLSVKMLPEYQLYFYQLNNNYFITQFGGPAFTGGDYLVYEIRDTGIREEWAFNSNIENSNFGDAPKDKSREKKMRYQPYK